MPSLLRECASRGYAGIASSLQATFVSVNSEDDYSVGSPQWLWANATLAAVDRSVTPWLIFVLHRPILCSDTSEEGALRLLLSPAQLPASLVAPHPSPARLPRPRRPPLRGLRAHPPALGRRPRAAGPHALLRALWCEAGAAALRPTLLPPSMRTVAPTRAAAAQFNGTVVQRSDATGTYRDPGAPVYIEQGTSGGESALLRHGVVPRSPSHPSSPPHSRPRRHQGLDRAAARLVRDAHCAPLRLWPPRTLGDARGLHARVRLCRQGRRCPRPLLDCQDAQVGGGLLGGLPRHK